MFRRGRKINPQEENEYNDKTSLVMSNDKKTADIFISRDMGILHEEDNSD